MKKSTYKKIMRGATDELQRDDRNASATRYTREFMSGVIDRFVLNGFEKTDTGDGYVDGYYGPVDFKNDIPQSVKNIRLWRGENTAEFSDVIGVCKNTVERWESGTNKPPKKTIRLLKKLREHA